MLRFEADPKILMIVVCIALLFIFMELDSNTWSSPAYIESGWISHVFFFLEDLVIETFQLLWEVVRFVANVLEYILNIFLGSLFSPPEKTPYELYKEAEKFSGLPWQVFWGIHSVESAIGKNLGDHRVMDVLAEDQRLHFLEICRNLGWNPYEIYGSKAGALGPFQILPETWIRYGIDGNGDGRRNPFTPEDAILTAAQYLVNKGGQENLGKALWHYNPDYNYVQRVLRYVEQN
jgi:hypothetical protein